MDKSASPIRPAAERADHADVHSFDDEARVIVTTDARHFRAVRLSIDPPPRLVPLDP